MREEKIFNPEAELFAGLQIEAYKSKMTFILLL